MKYYVLGELEVTDDSWVGEYLAQVTPLVHKHDGRYLARTGRLESLEGEGKPPQVQVLLEFPSRENAMAFYESPEYAPYREQRQAGSRSRLLLVAGEDMAAQGA